MKRISMGRLAVLALLATVVTGCAAPKGVRDAVDEMKVPVIALMDRYAEIVSKVKHPEGPGKTLLLRARLMELGQKDFEQFHGLQSRVAEWHEGSPFNMDEAKKFAELGLKLRKQLEKEE